MYKRRHKQLKLVNSCQITVEYRVTPRPFSGSSEQGEIAPPNFGRNDTKLSPSKGLNTQYMRNPDMVYILKMEYVSKINIFGLKMMVKSGLEKYF